MKPARWVGVGSSEGLEKGAGAQATADALLDDDAKLLIVFCSQSHDLSAVLREIRVPFAVGVLKTRFVLNPPQSSS